MNQQGDSQRAVYCKCVSISQHGVQCIFKEYEEKEQVEYKRSDRPKKQVQQMNSI